MEWSDGWPIIGQYQQGDTVGEPVETWRMPVVPQSIESGDHLSSRHSLYDEQIELIDGIDGAFGLQWQWEANIQADWYATDYEHQEIRLYACSFPSHLENVTDKALLYEAPQLLLQKLPSTHFTATTCLHIYPQSVTERFGITLFGRTYTYLAIEKNAEQQYRLSLIRGYTYQDEDGQELEHPVEQEVWHTILDDLEVISSQPYMPNPIYMRVSVWLDNESAHHLSPISEAREDQIPVSILHAAQSQFSYSLDGTNFIDIPYVASVHPGHWVGAKVGIFAVDLNRVSERIELTDQDQGTIGYAEYSSFVVEQQSQSI